MARRIKKAEIGYESATVAVVKIVFEESGVSDVVVNSRILNSLRTTDVFPVVASLPPKIGREATTGNTSAVRRLYSKRLQKEDFSTANGLKTCECEQGRRKITGKVVEWMENRTEISIPNLLQREILRGQIKNHSHATHLYLRENLCSEF